MRDQFAYSNGHAPLEPWNVVDTGSDDDWREVTEEGELEEIQAALT